MNDNNKLLINNDRDKFRVKSWSKFDDSYKSNLDRSNDHYKNLLRSTLLQPSSTDFGRKIPKRQWFERFDPEPTLERDPKLNIIYKNDFNSRLYSTRSRMNLPPPVNFKKYHFVDPANFSEELVPIRLDFDSDYLKLKEVFCYNLSEPHITPKIIADSLCHDFSLPHLSASQPIENSIISQIEEFKSNLSSHLPLNFKTNGNLNTDDIKFWDDVKNDDFSNVKIENNDDDQVFNENNNNNNFEDFRILIKLDIVHPPHHLVDQFEWSLSSNFFNDSPELFANTFTTELGLPGEFKTSIAHSIREQCSSHIKSLISLGLEINNENDSKLESYKIDDIVDEDLRNCFLPQLSSSAIIERNPIEANEFTPKLDTLTSDEILQYERDREKENRKRKRLTKNKKNLMISNLEPLKTIRSPIVFPDSFISVPQSFVNNDNNNDKPHQSQQQPQFNLPRRAAAAQAAAHIQASAQAELADVEDEVGTLSDQELNEKGSEIAKKSFMTSAKKPRFILSPPRYKPNYNYNNLKRLRDNTKPFMFEDEDQNYNLLKLGHGDIYKYNHDLNENGMNIDQKPLPKYLNQNKKYSQATLNIYSYFSTENQHENWIDGVWHCSNCGVPEQYAIGRRKGPMGDKSLCGECGRYLHKMRKNRPVNYTTSVDYHRSQKEAIENEKERQIQVQKANAQRYRRELKANKQAAKIAREAEKEEELLKVNDDDLNDQDEFEPPNPYQRIKKGKRKSMDEDDDYEDDDYEDTDRKITNKSRWNRLSVDDNQSQRSPSSSFSETNNDNYINQLQAQQQSSNSNSALPPQWLVDATKILRSKYKNDQFLIIEKPKPQQINDFKVNIITEWRLKCLDCPGKMYTPGPGESADNFEKHLKNRQHKQKVLQRLEKESIPNVNNSNNININNSADNRFNSLSPVPLSHQPPSSQPQPRPNSQQHQPQPLPQSQPSIPQDHYHYSQNPQLQHLQQQQPYFNNNQFANQINIPSFGLGQHYPQFQQSQQLQQQPQHQIQIQQSPQPPNQPNE